MKNKNVSVYMAVEHNERTKIGVKHKVGLVIKTLLISSSLLATVACANIGEEVGYGANSYATDYDVPASQQIAVASEIQFEGIQDAVDVMKSLYGQGLMGRDALTAFTQVLQKLESDLNAGRVEIDITNNKNKDIVHALSEADILFETMAQNPKISKIPNFASTHQLLQKINYKDNIGITVSKEKGITAFTPSQTCKALYVYVNGVQVDFPDTQPYIDQNSRTLVPVRFVSEALGGKVSWDNDTWTASIVQGTEMLDIPIGSKRFFKNDQAQFMDTRAVINNARTMVPIRFVSEALGADIAWRQAGGSGLVFAFTGNPTQEEQQQIIDEIVQQIEAGEQAEAPPTEIITELTPEQIDEAWTRQTLLPRFRHNPDTWGASCPETGNFASMREMTNFAEGFLNAWLTFDGTDPADLDRWEKAVLPFFNGVVESSWLEDARKEFEDGKIISRGHVFIDQMNSTLVDGGFEVEAVVICSHTGWTAIATVRIAGDTDPTEKGMLTISNLEFREVK